MVGMEAGVSLPWRLLTYRHRLPLPMLLCDLHFLCRLAKPNLKEHLGKYVLVLNCVFYSSPAFGNLVHGEDLKCEEKVSFPLDGGSS